MNENEQHFGVKRGSNLSVVERLMMIFSPNVDVCWITRGMASRHKLLKSKRPWWTLPLASGLPDAQQSHWTPTIFVMYSTKIAQLSASANNSRGLEIHGQYYSGRIVFQCGNLRLPLWKIVWTNIHAGTSLSPNTSNTSLSRLSQRLPWSTFAFKAPCPIASNSWSFW